MSKSFLMSVALCAGLWPALPAAASDSALATVAVKSSADPASQAFDAVVEAVRSSVIAAQVAGAIVELNVKAGDQVKAGQPLLRIDARAAEQNAGASDAQVRSAQALQDVARKDFERQKQLFEEQYISQAALERAESQFKATQAQAAAQLAQANAARTQSGLHLLRAPFSGTVADVPVALGDMAMPGKPLLTLYEPGTLRVTVAVPQSLLGTLPGHALLGAQYTATSMIGMIALAGIIVRNSILLVDFINLQLREGMPFEQAVVNSAITRAQPILLTGLAAMLGAFFILDDPIFNGLAISLIFGILVSTLLTLVVIPLLYFVAYRNNLSKLIPQPSQGD